MAVLLKRLPMDYYTSEVNGCTVSILPQIFAGNSVLPAGLRLNAQRSRDGGHIQVLPASIQLIQKPCAPTVCQPQQCCSRSRVGSSLVCVHCLCYYRYLDMMYRHDHLLHREIVLPTFLACAACMQAGPPIHSYPRVQSKSHGGFTFIVTYHMQLRCCNVFLCCQHAWLPVVVSWNRLFLR